MLFGLLPEEAGAWEAAVSRLSRHWNSLLEQEPPPARSGEWVGAYQSNEEAFPTVVWQVAEGLECCVGVRFR